MKCISISHRTAPLEIRGRLAFSKEEVGQFYRWAGEQSEISGAVLVSTCNRLEAYLTDNGQGFAAIRDYFSKRKGISDAALAEHYRFYQEERALQHLFSVCGGLDSMLQGEDEILGQMKQAYETAAAAGCLNYELQVCFRDAIASAKRMKTDTAISTTPVSIGTLCAKAVFSFPKENKTVLLIGASGRMGGIVLKNLLGHPEIRVIVALRSHCAETGRLEEQLTLQLEQRGGHSLSYREHRSQVTVIEYRDRYQAAAEADLMISATASPHYTITAEAMERYQVPVRRRRLLDLAVPADIDERLADWPQTELWNMDTFQRMAKENGERKQQELERMKQILEEDLERTKKELDFHSFLPRLQDLCEKVSSQGFEKLMYQMKKKASAEGFAAFLKICDDYAQNV